MPLKADPFGFEAELRPSTASVVADSADFALDRRRLHGRSARQGEPRREPMSIYEVHLGSWRRGDGRPLPHLRRARRQLDPLCRRPRLHPSRTAADQRASARRVLGLPADRPVRADAALRRAGRLRPLRRPRPRGGARRDPRLGARRISRPTRTASARFDGDAALRARRPAQGLPSGLEHRDLQFRPPRGRQLPARNALYWLDRYHIDGLRVDAVASMLYLDYSRKPGEWLPNADGGNENRDAIAFLQRVNELVYGEHPGAVTIAEESTACRRRLACRPISAASASASSGTWAGCTTRSTTCRSDPIYRRWHHDKMTFGLLYAFTENFVLPISHDEVVHGKRSVVGKMPGDEWQRFANARAYYGFMWGHPGKKLLFMGQEFGQTSEWNCNEALPWWLLEFMAASGRAGAGPRPQPALPRRARAACARLRAGRLPLDRRRRRRAVGVRLPALRRRRPTRRSPSSATSRPMPRYELPHRPAARRPLARSARTPTRQSMAAPTSATSAASTPKRGRCTASLPRPR